MSAETTQLDDRAHPERGGHRRGRIVVGVTEDPSGRAAQRWAADEAALRGIEVDGIHVGSAEGRPGRILVAAARGAEALVVGASGSPRSRLGIGGTDVHCVTHAACPVVVVPEAADDHEPRPTRRPRVVVGIDGSTSADAALRWATAEADLRRWPLTAVMAWSYLDQHRPGRDDEFHPEYDGSEAIASLREIIAAIPDEHQVVPVLETPNDLPEDALVDAAAPQDLLVVGARGHSSLAGRLLGSVSLRCVLHARCPTVVVRQPDS